MSVHGETILQVTREVGVPVVSAPHRDVTGGDSPSPPLIDYLCLCAAQRRFSIWLLVTLRFSAAYGAIVGLNGRNEAPEKHF